MYPDDLVRIDWPLFRKFTQLQKREEPEEHDETIEDKKRSMQVCINFIKDTYGDDLGLPNPEDLPWDN